MGVLKNMADAIQDINKQLGIMKQDGELKAQQDAIKEREQKLEDDAYNRGYGDAESMIGDPLGEGIMSDDQEMFSEGEADMNLPPEILQGLENLSDDELALLRASDPSVADLLR